MRHNHLHHVPLALVALAKLHDAVLEHRFGLGDLVHSPCGSLGWGWGHDERGALSETNARMNEALFGAMLWLFHVPWAARNCAALIVKKDLVVLPEYGIDALAVDVIRSQQMRLDQELQRVRIPSTESPMKIAPRAAHEVVPVRVCPLFPGAHQHVTSSGSGDGAGAWPTGTARRSEQLVRCCSDAVCCAASECHITACQGADNANQHAHGRQNKLGPRGRGPRAACQPGRPPVPALRRHVAGFSFLWKTLLGWSSCRK